MQPSEMGWDPRPCRLWWGLYMDLPVLVTACRLLVVVLLTPGSAASGWGTVSTAPEPVQDNVVFSLLAAAGKATVRCA